ncbi:MAG: hypothetical protein NTX72_00820 [Candidatus Uhrbacteria bacterium]|nr:hypothetical protein [Candidatus Uhrbacteria bacterium]
MEEPRQFGHPKHKIHATQIGTQSAIEALSASKGHFILINANMHAYSKTTARHPNFQADAFATQDEAEAEKRMLNTLSSRFVEHAVREINDAFIEEFRRVREDHTTRPNTFQGPNHR